MAALVSPPDQLIPAFSVVGPTRSSQASAPRFAHPAGKGTTSRCLATGGLRQIATGLAQSSLDTEHVWTEGTGRRYTQLLDTALYDVWLINWSPSADLDLHDHGGSQGVVVVAAGRLNETYTDLQRCHPLRTQTIKKAESLTITATRVHAISNPGPHDALSVHVYSPPLREMTFYEHRPGNRLTPVVTREGDLATLEQTTT